MKALKIILALLIFGQFVALLSPHTLNEKLLHAALFAVFTFALIAAHKKSKK